MLTQVETTSMFPFYAHYIPESLPLHRYHLLAKHPLLHFHEGKGLKYTVHTLLHILVISSNTVTQSSCKHVLTYVFGGCSMGTKKTGDKRYLIFTASETVFVM